jgi:high affinity Mn2+ porin
MEAICAGLALACMLASGQTAPDPSQSETVPSGAGSPQPSERWNLFFQATSVGQYHGRFHAPYEGPNSLRDYPESDVSLTTTLYFGLRLARNTQLYFNPEIAGGRGFSHVNGIANFTNGELPRVASATPKPYLARLYITQDFGFGSEKESFSSDENQLAGERPMTRYSISIGRFTVTDFFDDNRYTHDPRTQFLGWAIMYNGAWDYPADVRGYTWGWVHEFHTRRWSVRYGSGAEPKVANGSQLDRKILVNRGDVWEFETRYSPRDHPGSIRLLGYANHARAGTYAEAIRMGEQTGEAPSVVATRRDGTLKYGFGINADQEITKDIGAFGRLAWNDGKTESFAFTAVDRLANAGVSMAGNRWKRRYDTAATAITIAGLSGVHALYLARGGLDFLIGDGALRYGTERVWETYYSARLFPGFFAGYDLQYVTNPAYNRDRGPVWVSSIRLHMELGKQTFSSHAAASTP